MANSYRERLQGLRRLPSIREMSPAGPESQQNIRSNGNGSIRFLPRPVLSTHYSEESMMPTGQSTWKHELTLRPASQTTPSKSTEPRQELPPISELFQTVDSSDARRQDHDNYVERSAPRHEHGNYTTQPSPYHNPAYAPRYDRRTTLRADYEPRIPVGERYPSSVAVGSGHDGHAGPGHNQHPPPFAREAHVHPHAAIGAHVMAPPYTTPIYPPQYYEAQYAHHPNIFWHPESGHYVQAWNGMDVGQGDQYPGRKRRGNLPKEATNQLKRWFAEHGDSPYPSEDEKQQLAVKTGLGMNQISNWFINARRRQPGRDAREAQQREQELREQELRQRQQQQQQQQQNKAASQPSATPSPTDESSGSVASIEREGRHKGFDVARASPPRTRSCVVTSPYSSHTATRHGLHRSARRSSTPETRRERRHR